MAEGIAEGIVAGLAEAIVTQLSSAALQEIGSALGVNKEVGRLQSMLTAFKEVLPHAENLQLRNNDVKIWLRRIKDAAYDAEDLIDDFANEALRKKTMTRGSIIERVRHFASSSDPFLQPFNLASRMNQVTEDLEDLLNDQSFGLLKGVHENFGFISVGQHHSYSGSWIIEKHVGREREREKIVKLLLDSTGRDYLSVIPIQGMGGIGKTVLAQLVYQDKRVVDNFENRMWVCVSDEFDVQKITEKIIRFGIYEKCPNLDKVQLQSRIRQLLGGKRYLLVLDDIWSEEMDKWEELRDLLIGGGGASGSKIIVTTRSSRVGSIMGTIVVQRLSKLSEVDCWNLFKGRAFNEEGDEEENPELVKIGKDIARKCAGVPLAAKILGGLCYRAKKEMWEFVRDSDVWRLPEDHNENLRALKISYNHLPIYLKQCFAYCAIFPKNFEIQKDVLIRLWIAQGFIPSFGNNQSLEDIGKEFVEVLMCRSFFQEPVVDNCDNLIKFKMHNLVHDLAKFVAGVECFTVCKNETIFPVGVRHLFFNVEKPYSPFKTHPKPSNIRTLVFTSKIDFSVGNIFSSLKYLRVFQFRNDDIDHLPNSIDKLKHLRYLQIECPKIKTLPESITNLQNLEVLYLLCHQLEKLPTRIQNMVNLKHIDFWKDHNPFEKSIPFLSDMPLGLGELKSLQTLLDFVVSKDKVGCTLNELNTLINLGGTIKIWNLENVKDAKDSEETNLKTKGNLQILSLHWDELFHCDIYGEAVGLVVLHNLEPHSNLKVLQIKGYVGTTFPRWMMKPLLHIPNVVKVEQLPPFSCFPFLKFLTLYHMDDVKCIEGTHDQSQKEWFPWLTKLTLIGFPNLESWFPIQRQISFPSLVELHIWDCPKLKNMPLLLPSIIKRLILYRTNGELVHSVLGEGNHFFTSLEQLSILQCEGMESWPNWLGPQLTSLRTLYIGCPRSLPFLPQQIQHLTALQMLGIWYYCEEALPEWMANITSLQSFNIHLCPNLQILPEWVLRANTTIHRLLIIDCPHLMRRYNQETGEDRHEIAHIKYADLFTNFLDYRNKNKNGKGKLQQN